MTGTVLILLSLVMYAGNNPEQPRTLFGKNGQLKRDSVLSIYDMSFEANKNVPGAIEKTWYVKNTVRFMVDEEAPAYIFSDFIASIKLNISSVNAAGVTTNHQQKILTIDYKTSEGVVSGSISSYEFRDAVSVTVTIAEDITKNVSWDVTKNLKLVTEIVSLRDWKFDCSTAFGYFRTDSLFYDEWKVKWEPSLLPVSFATGYDLEWAWIDETAVSEYTFGGVVNVDSVFENNSSRVNLKFAEIDYRIPLLYEDDGRLYARIRQVQEKANGQRLEGNWYYLNNNGLGYLKKYPGDGHQDSLNWQATTTYAEEGKRKTVIQYFDGTLRGRQTVTKDNVNRKTVVAESFYDYQGRPVIQVLPAPTLSNMITFTRNLNRFDDAGNAKTVYDKLDISQSSCNKQTARMLSTAAGSAAQYYSTSNPGVNDGFNKYIPDADGYPYTETRYSSDGTGRIDAQGGVGRLYQVNGGKETKYYYESADPDDLNALFGTDAGYASHYSKTWVRDANGQYSVSYTDMKGRTVATALAGNKPTNLDALPSLAAANKTITRQLIDNETNNVHGNSIISSKSLVVPKAGDYQFNYSLSPEKLRMMLCTGDSICFDCLYELNISIIPDCSDKVITNNTVPVTTFSNPVIKKNFTLGQYLTTCGPGNSPLLDTSFSVRLPEGSYTIVKELKLNTAARDWYRENRFISADTCKKKIDFINQQYQLAINQMNCYTTCEQCNQKLGSETDFVNRFRTESGLPENTIQAMMPEIKAAYQQAKANCEAICNDTNYETTDELDDIRALMLQDMIPPVGQYARRNDIDNPGNQNRVFNIFNLSPVLTLCSPAGPPYKKPATYNVSTGGVTVTCLNGSQGYKNQFGYTALSQEQVNNMSDDAFSDIFEESFAESLLPYHPEFCKLSFAEANLKGTYRFGGKLLNTDTWAQAVGQGLINTLTANANTAADALMQKDSFFMKIGFNHALYYEMRTAITSNFFRAKLECPGSQDMGMWAMAKYSVFCFKEIKDNSNQQLIQGCFTPTPSLLACLTSQNNLPPVNDGSHCTADMDRVWKNFRTLYITFRDILISKYLSQNCSIDYTIFNTNSGNNYQERFRRYKDIPPYFPEGIGDVQSMFNEDPQTYVNLSQAEADSICRANSGNWMLKLRLCTAVETYAANNPAAWSADSTWLSHYLVDVCRQGVDYMGHPFGASSLPDLKASVQLLTNPDGTTLSGVFVRSFPDIIRYYLIFRFGPSAINSVCYPELIDYPKAYNVAPPSVSLPLITAPEPCVCERINYFRTKWQNAGSPGTFSNYLLNTQGTSISQDTLNMLVNMCNTGYVSQNPNCNFLSAPVKIPAIFQCRGSASLDSSKTCITCGDYMAIKQQFLTERGVSAPYNNPQNENELAWNKAFADYANYRTGFTKLWTEYVQFGITCANDSTMSCTNLNSLVAAWPATNPPSTGDSCRNSFTQFMNYHTSRNLTFNQWMDEFVKANCNKPPVCQPVLTCSRIKSLVNSYYSYYGYQIWRNANCQNLFTQFVNDSLGTNYSYQDIINNNNYLCGSDCPLNVCSFPNSHLLTHIYKKYKSQVYQSTWTLTQCQTNFTNWFNTQLGFTSNPYTWSAIVSLYQSQAGGGSTGEGNCVPDINQLCTPPYSCNQLNYLVQQFYALYPNADSLGNCQVLFTAWFNQQLGTSYTFLEIQSIYSTVCGGALPVCTGGSYWDCCDLILFYQRIIEQYNSGQIYCQNFGSTFCNCFTSQFNAHYNKSYTYEQIKQLYYTHCGFTVMSCPLEPPVFTCPLLQTALGEFMKQYPGGGCKDSCQQFFASWFNNHFGTLYTYNDIANLYLVQCGEPLQVCESNCPDYIAFVNNYNSRYGNIKIPLLARRQLFESLFNETFGYTGGGGGSTDEKGGGGNSPLVYSQIKSLMAGCIAMPASLEYENLYLTLNDANVLSDFKTAFYLRNPGGVQEKCETDFTAWVNWTMGVNKTWCELADLYKTILGNGAENICGTSAACGSSGGSSFGEGEKGVPLDGGGTATPITYPPMLCGLNVEIFNPLPVDTSTCHSPMLIAINDATIKWELYLDSLRRNFDTAWYNKCIKAKNLESFTVSFDKAEYHYTLYYYDQAGQLVRTVPPEGVVDKRSDAAFLASVKNARKTNAATPVLPGHTMATEYRYNTLGQVVQQKSPDGGLSKFWYDYLGRLVVSQNAQQALNNKYSYTLYDELGRIQEVGQKPQTSEMTQTISRNKDLLQAWINGSNNKEQLTRTVYDAPYAGTEFSFLLVQRNLRNRVSYTQVWNMSNQSYANSATYYTYDIHGNVDTLLQDYGHSSNANIMNQATGHRFKRIAYNYDLISGKVNMVSYQPGYISPVTNEWVNNADRFYHRYSYDAENKLTGVETSRDSLLWERDATYYYYKHGPLARTVLGQQQVQGVDYAYTLQGWLKGVNSTAPSNSPEGGGQGIYDIGGDGKLGSSNTLVARDAYGFSLNYYTATIGSNTVNDYKSINNTVTPFVNNVFNLTNTNSTLVAKPLFNGNIAAMAVNIPKLGTASVYGYQYDQLNRITSMDAFTGINNTNNTFTASTTANYKERVTYDANGNIKTYLRNGDAARQYMDDMVYSYKAGTNQLDRVVDAAPDAAGNYSLYNDLKQTQPNGSQGQATGNYTYDAIGNLKTDISEGITNITWSVYGKILSVTKASGTITYTYDASGNRISKEANGKTTWYVRDASGNVMAVYEKRSDLNSNHLTQSEVHLYGSSRLGIYNINRDLEAAPSGQITNFERGRKFFELSNHLGNVLVTISDRKLQVSSGGVTVDYYTADLVSATDFYPFGMAMPGRNFSSEKYRYSINGQEKTPEIFEGSTTALYWEYDSRIGRRWNVDPKPQTYSSPYAVFDNSPVWRSDAQGDSAIVPLPQSVERSLRRANTNTSGSTCQNCHVNKQLYAQPPPAEAPKVGPGKPATAAEEKQIQENLKKKAANGGVDDTYTLNKIKQGNIEAVENSPTNFFPFISNLKKAGKYELMGMHSEALSSTKDFGIEVAITVVGGKVASEGFKYLSATKEVTVIGEGMARVEVAASKIPGAKILNDMPKFTGTRTQVTSQMMTYNRQWILQQMRSGRPILDIGRDLYRANPSIFYQMEQNMMKNYLKLHPNAFQVIKP